MKPNNESTTTFITCLPAGRLIALVSVYLENSFGIFSRLFLFTKLVAETRK